MEMTYRVVSEHAKRARQELPVVVALPQHKVVDQLDVSEDGSRFQVRTTIMNGPRP
jgi:hypothetical protein